MYNFGKKYSDVHSNCAFVHDDLMEYFTTLIMVLMHAIRSDKHQNLGSSF